MALADVVIHAGNAALEDAEEAFDLVQPRRAGRREVKLHIGMGLEPRFVLLVGVEVVEHDVDVAIGVIGHDLVHEVEELDTAPPTVVAGPDLAGSHVERGKEGGRARAGYSHGCVR